MTELAQDIKRLAGEAYQGAPLEMRDSLSKDAFIEALNDSNLEWTIFQGRPQTLQEALSVALEYEAFQAGRDRRNHHNIQPPFNRMRYQRQEGDISFEMHHDRILTDEDEFKYEREIVNRLARMEQQTNGENRKNNCFYCQREGHWRDKCPLRRRGLPRASPKNDRIFYNSQAKTLAHLGVNL